MKKLSLMIGAILLGTTAFGAQLQLNAGVEPWRQVGNTKYDTGYSLGAEVLFNAENHPFDYGIGTEWKSNFKGGDSNSTDEIKDIVPIYLTGKYHFMNDAFYGVGRAGWSFVGKNRTDDGMYLGAGLGKDFGPLTVETLYETIDLQGKSKLYDGNNAGMVSIKVGYIFGENTRVKLAKEAAMQAEIAKQEYIKQQKAEAEAALLNKLETKVVVEDNYKVNQLEAENLDMNKIDFLVANVENRQGTIYVDGYTDNRGSKKVNDKLSLERAEKVAKVIEGKLTTENVAVKAEGKGATNFLNNNATKEERALNRRVEVYFQANN
ncbi:MAG: OmpA family protein [Cetobacterium sp.]|uniref:OmpA family protein n=1 Tax=Cetobacterium sp. TaxID=2071632 RepID=UPI003F3E9F3E